MKDLKPVLPEILSEILPELKRVNRTNRALPTLVRQPVHVLYGGAHLFTAKTPEKLAMLAKKALLENTPSPEDLDRALGTDRTHRIFERVLEKLEREAIEDLRIDFEDGYGQRSDAEEDQQAVRAACELGLALKSGIMPPYFGIRIKSLSDETAERAIRTLDLFLSAWTKDGGRKLPENFVITLPKVTSSAQVAVFVKVLERLEKKLKLAARSLRFEIMVELPELLMNRQGGCELPLLLAKSKGRLKSAHFGIYDYLSACDVASSAQALTHSACDHARSVMQTAFSGTSVLLSDGATHVTPAGLDRSGVLEAWKLSYANIRHALTHGFYQGWDLHPAQVAIRYAAVYSFFSENLPASTRRMKNFLGAAARASQVGQHFDDEASAQGLLGFFMRGFASGAISEEDLSVAGLRPGMLETRSFRTIFRDRA